MKCFLNSFIINWYSTIVLIYEHVLLHNWYSTIVLTYEHVLLHMLQKSWGRTYASVHLAVASLKALYSQMPSSWPALHKVIID